MNNEISKEFEEVVNKIRNKIETKKIIIFGSYAKGKETENSDIDLCIITEEKISKHSTGRKIVLRYMNCRNIIKITRKSIFEKIWNT